jgi:hypothetical protein
MCTTTGRGEAKKRAFSVVTSAPLASSVIRSAPAASGTMLSTINTVGASHAALFLLTIAFINFSYIIDLIRLISG